MEYQAGVGQLVVDDPAGNEYGQVLFGSDIRGRSRLNIRPRTEWTYNSLKMVLLSRTLLTLMVLTIVKTVRTRSNI